MRIGFRQSFLFCSAVNGLLVVMLSSNPAFADYNVITKSGQTLRWESFSLEDGSYCTWKNGGKFCLPINGVISINEAASSNDPTGGQGQVTTRPVPTQQSGERRGTMTRSIDQGSIDGRSSYSGQGRRGGSNYQSYDMNSSNTTYSTEVDAADIRRIEADAAFKGIQQNDRRNELERERQVSLMQQQQRDEQDRRNRDQQREWDRIRVR